MKTAQVVLVEVRANFQKLNYVTSIFRKKRIFENKNSFESFFLEECLIFLKEHLLNDRETLGCSTGFCSTIQNRVSSTTGMSRFWEEKKSINQCERERENESQTKH